MPVVGQSQYCMIESIYFLGQFAVQGADHPEEHT